MRHALFTAAGVRTLAVLVVVLSPVAGGAQGPATKKGAGAIVPRTPDGRPDLQGVWDFRTATPLERPSEFAGREFLSDSEIAEFERRAAVREDGRPPEDARSEPSVHAPWWLDYGKQVVGTHRSSLIVDPPDGRMPPLTAEAQKRAAERRTALGGRGPADSPEDRSLWERCITRGLPEGMLPAGYNNNVQIIQTPTYIVLVTEMIHDARIVPMDGRAHLAANIRPWTGDSRGHWEGDALVVETTNFSDRTPFRGSTQGLRLIERFTRVDADSIDYRFTVHDETTWSRPWTVTFPLVRNDSPMFEYACHEGNHSLENILRNARAVERRP
jgi:hypothetical protein